MKRMLIIVLVVVLGGFAVTHQLIAGKIGDGLDDLSQNMAAVGSLSYGTIYVTPDGTANVLDLVFLPNGTAGDVRIEKASVQTDNLKQLYALSRGIQGGEPPRSLKLVFEGIQADLGDALLDDLQNSDGETTDLFASGCGDRSYFTYADKDAMGYSEPVSDMTLEYAMPPSRDSMTLSGDWTTRGMLSIDYEMNLEVPAGQTGAAAAMGMKLHRAKLTYQDLGYMDAIVSFCARETGLDQDNYIEQHFNAWKADWAELSLAPGEGLVKAYREFLDKPQSLSIETYPEMSAMQAMSVTTPQAMMERLDPQIRVNDGAPRSFRVRVVEQRFDPGQGDDGEAATADSESSEDVEGPKHERKPVLLARSEWSRHIGKPVWVTLQDGRRFEGRILELSDGTMQFQQNVYDGRMVMPLSLDDVDDVYLKPE